MPCESHSGCPISAAQQDFRARIVAEIERADEFLALNRSTDDEKAAFTGSTLGAFAGGRIDAARFSSLIGADRRADPTTLTRVDEAASQLRELAAGIDAYTKIAVPPHGSLQETVAAALAEIGRVFGAARVIELARSERYVEATHGRLLRGLPPAAWSAAERGVVPWMRVIVRGGQIQAAGLAAFLDGSLKILLKAEGEVPPAPLARLASPGIYVGQVTGKAELDHWKSFDGPAVGLLGGDGAALFTHDPRKGSHPWQRITVSDLPKARRRGLGGLSVFQMNEDLALLVALAAEPTTPAAAPVPAPAPAGEPAADPADQLASWLLGQAGLTGAGKT